mgnify:CR=1 FL=1
MGRLSFSFSHSAKRSRALASQHNLQPKQKKPTDSAGGLRGKRCGGLKTFV